MNWDLIGFTLWCAVIFALFVWMLCLFFEARAGKRRTDALYAAAREADRQYYAALWEYLNRKGDDNGA